MSQSSVRLLCAFCIVAVAAAQTPTGMIVGSITDSTGASVHGARIELTHEQTGLVRKTNSDVVGSFRIPDLPVGSYALSVEAQGFKKYQQNSILVTVNRNVTVDVLLQVGALWETVSVTTAPPQVDTVSGTLASVVASREAEELPLNGRNVLQLMALNPGMYSASMTSHNYTGNPRYSINGTRADHINYLMDGATNNDEQNNLSNYFPNPDAVQEFSVLNSSFSAEYGAPGGVVNAVSKSGTNRVHGSAFEFLRNQKLNSSDFFSHQKDALKRNQFGGAFGGPVYFPKLYKGHDKTFFFYSFQATRNRSVPTNRTTNVPTAAERSGDFSATKLARPLDPITGKPFMFNGQADVIDPARFDAAIVKLINAFVPLPNAGGNLLRYAVAAPSNNYEHLARVDHSITEKDKLTARFFLFNFEAPAARPVPLGSILNIFSGASGATNQAANVVLSETHLFGPALLNNLTLSYNRLINVPIAPYPDKNPCDFGRKTYCFPGGLRLTTTQFAFPGETNSRNPAQSYRIADNVSWTRGIHNLKFGADFRRVQSDLNTDSGGNGFPSFSGQLTGNVFADLLLGFDAQDNGQLPSRQRLRGFFQSYFGQDDIRINRRLTINVGLRWDPFNPWVEADDKLKTWDATAYRNGTVSQRFVNAPSGLLFVGDQGLPRSIIGSRYSQVAPRFGFAFSPSASGRTSIRGGYGLFYDQQVEPILIQREQNDFPFNSSWNWFGVSYSDPFNGGPDPKAAYKFPPPKDIPFSLPVALVSGLALDFRPAYVQQWNLTVERQIVSDLMLRISYVGTKGTHLQSTRNINPAVYIPGNSTVANTNGRRIYGKYFGQINLNFSDALSIYHGFQTTLEKRFNHSVQFNVNYSCSRNIDMGSQTLQGGDCCGADVAQNPYDLRADRGLADFDIQHRFVASGIWNIPAPHWNSITNAFLGGWELTPILTAQTGVPLNITTGQDRSLSGNGFDRPDVIGNPVLSNSRSKQDKIAKYFDPSVFVLNPLGQFGSLGRNAVRGPGLINLDTGLFKNFPIKEYGTIQFRWEMFNAFNHANLSNPILVIGPNLGRILSTQASRIMQMSLKYQF